MTQKNKSINEKAFKDFSKMLDVSDKDLFNVGYYIKQKHSARKSVGDALDTNPYQNNRRAIFTNTRRSTDLP